MSKKDRTAIVVSVIYLILAVIGFEGDPVPITLFGGIPVLIYWGVRFIRGNISFIGAKYKED